MEQEELHQSIVWYQEDAAYSYRQVERYLDKTWTFWIAAKLQDSAAHSSMMARKLMGIE